MFFLLWVGCGLVLVSVAGCFTQKNSRSEQAAELLAKAQGTQAPFAGQIESGRRQADVLQNEELQLRRILDRWIEAQGGRKRLAILKNIRCRLAIDAGGNRDYITTAETSDGFYRYELVGAETAVCGGFDGQTNWQNRGSWGASLRPGFTGSPYWSAHCLRALKLERQYATHRVLPEELVDGQSCSVVLFTSAEGQEERWYFETLSGLLRQVVKKVSPKQEIVLRYSDYRGLARVQVPHEVSVVEPGGAKIVYRIAGAELNLIGRDVQFSPPDNLRNEQNEIDELLKRSMGAGYGKSVEGRACLTHATLFSPTTGMQTKVKVYRRKPGYVLVDKESPGAGRTVSGFDGKVGWENSEILGFHLLKEAELSELFSLSWLGCDPYLRERFPLRAKVGEGKLGDREIVKLRMRNANGLNGIFSFDKELARLLRVEMEENAAARFQAMKVEYSDYRAVDSLVMPFRIAYQSGGIETVIMCDAVELDIDMPDALFSPRTDTD